MIDNIHIRGRMEMEQRTMQRVDVGAINMFKLSLSRSSQPGRQVTSEALKLLLYRTHRKKKQSESHTHPHILALCLYLYDHLHTPV